MLLWVSQNTNLKIAGGYTSLSSWTSMTSIFEELWLSGWGLALFDQSGFRRQGPMSYYQYDLHDGHKILDANNNPVTHPVSRGLGASDAELYVKKVNDVAPNLARAVLYVDNESPPSDDFGHIIEYYRGFYSWLETQPAGAVTIRPGLYAHINILGELLKEFPYLYVCDDQYPVGAGSPPKLDPDSVNRAPGGVAVQFISSKNNAIPLAGSGGPRNLVGAASPGSRGPEKQWFMWPAVFQWQGNNPAPLSTHQERVAAGGQNYPILFSANTWYVDYDSALVDDPAFPSVSPRLSLAVGRDDFCMVRLDRSPTGEADSRSGVLRPLSVQLGNRVSALTVTSPDGGARRSPDLRPIWLAATSQEIGPSQDAGAHKVLVVAERNGLDHYLATYEWTSSGFTSICKNAVAAGPKLAPGVRFTGAASADDNAGLIVASPKGEIYVAQAAPNSSSWNFRPLGGAPVIHPFSQLTATRRFKQSVDCFFIDSYRVLHSAWLSSNAWSHSPLDSKQDLLLPTTAIACCSPNAHSIVVAAVGYKLQLVIYSWSDRDGKFWVAPKDASDALDGLLCAHTDLAMAWNPYGFCVEVLATDNQGKLCLYQLKEDATSPSRWKLSARILLDSPQGSLVQADPMVRQVPAAKMFGDIAPNPFGDLVLGFNGLGQRVMGGLFNFPPGLARPAFCQSIGPSPPSATPAWTLLN